MDSSFLYTVTGWLISLANLALAAAFLVAGFLAFQTSQLREELASLKIVAAGFGGLGLLTVAGMFFRWVMRMVLGSLGGDGWAVFNLISGVGGAALDIVCIGAVAWGFVQLKKVASA